MEEAKKYQKLDLNAILEDVQKGNDRMKKAAVRQYANFFEIYTGRYSVKTDEILAISLLLFGVHNAIEVGCVGMLEDMKGLILQGSVYHILPKYTVEGGFVVGKERILRSHGE